MKVIENPQWKVSQKGHSIALYRSAESTWAEGHPSPLLLIGGVHGDEPEGVWLAEATLEWLKTVNSEELKRPWLLIPCLNPDGYKAGTRVNGNGVDLNRNYPSKNWSKEFSKERYNPGPAPGSEVETQAVVELVQKYKPQFIIHCHSWEPCIVCTGSEALPLARHLSESSGYEVREDIGYPTPGSLSQYGWADNNIPVICIEEAEHTEKQKVWPHFANGIKAVFKSC